MASPFKIPKKKQPEASDSFHLHSQSPLSRLQSSAPEIKMGYGHQSSRGSADRMHAGNALGSSTSRQSVPCKPVFRDYVKSLLGLNSPNRGAPTANHRAPGSCGRQSQPGQKAQSSSGCVSNGWRPKRASDRLLSPDETSEPLTPPQKKKSDFGGPPRSTKNISVESLDYLAELRGEEHAGSLSSPTQKTRTWRRVETDGDAAEEKSDTGSSPESLKQQKKKSSGSDRTSEDDFVSPPRNKPSADKCLPKDVRRPCWSPRPTAVTRRGLNRTSWLAGSSNLMEDLREKEREKWRAFREKKTANRSAVLQLRLRKPKAAEPIVLSSEEEEEGEDDADGRKRTLQSSRVDESHLGNPEEMQGQRACSSKGEVDGFKPAPPTFLQLHFTSLHAGLTHADASGEMMITEHGFTIPLKGVEEVSVVASQVRGYGVWDGGVAQGGGLLAGWKGPAPSLIFLWVTDAQAHLLQTELSSIQTSTAASGPVCSFLLLVLKEQLQELQAALLASILDMEEYKKASSSSSGPTSPLEWTDGLLLLHSCPPPLDQHLLGLLGHSVEKSSPVRKSNLRSSALQQLPTRLIQYPAAPCKGRITVTKEDLACLAGGEFLNDVIIDFYLKYLLLEGVGGSAAERSHVFSSFFYKQLSRRRAAGEDAAPSVPDRHMRHQRVKTWTRQVDIFTKDFLFVPVNQE